MQGGRFFQYQRRRFGRFYPGSADCGDQIQEDGNKEKLADLIKGGTVLRLTGDVKVQVMERSVVFKTLKIKIPDEKELYWVKDGSLKELPCN